MLKLARRLAVHEYPHQLYHTFTAADTIVCAMVRLKVSYRTFLSMLLVSAIR